MTPETEAMIAAAAAGITGMLIQELRWRLRRPSSPVERRRENTSDAIKAAVEAAMTSHIGDGNGHIKESISRIETYILQTQPRDCADKHQVVNGRLDALEGKRG